MKFLRQSTTTTIQFGPIADVSNGVTPETGLATALGTASTGLRISKNGSAYADRSSATAITHDTLGSYLIELNSTDTNTAGRLRLLFEEEATCLTHWEDYMVLTANAYDSLVLGTDNLDTNAAQIGGTIQTGNDIGQDIADMSLGIILGTCGSTDLTAATCSSNLTGYTANQLVGRLITFTSGNAEGEQSNITAYAVTNGVLTFSALTLAPGNTDTFKIT